MWAKLKKKLVVELTTEDKSSEKGWAEVPIYLQEYIEVANWKIDDEGNLVPENIEFFNNLFIEGLKEQRKGIQKRPVKYKGNLFTNDETTYNILKRKSENVLNNEIDSVLNPDEFVFKFDSGEFITLTNLDAGLICKAMDFASQQGFNLEYKYTSLINEETDFTKKYWIYNTALGSEEWNKFNPETFDFADEFNVSEDDIKLLYEEAVKLAEAS